jgi:hypothetical protein
MISTETVARISAVLFLSGLVVLLIGLTVGPNMADADGRRRNCEALLANNLYGCSFHFENGVKQNVNLQFSGGVAVTAVNATLVFDGACQCGAQGSFKKPRFGASSEFFCLDADEGILTGDAKEKSIEGEFFGSGSTPPAVFKCVR